MSSILLGAIAAFASGPVGWVIGGAGTAISIFAGTLKSKRKRRSEAASHIHTQLTQQLKANEEKVLEQTRQQIEKCSEAMASAVDNYFEQLSDGLENISNHLRQAETGLSKAVRTINSAYAERIMEYAGGKTQRVSRVQRDFGKQIEIWPIKSRSRTAPLARDVDELSRILQEKIIIH